MKGTARTITVKLTDREFGALEEAVAAAWPDDVHAKNALTSGWARVVDAWVERDRSRRAGL